jgi:hypothetical protein
MFYGSLLWCHVSLAHRLQEQPYTAFDYPAGVSDIAATLQVARTLSGASGKVGLMGGIHFDRDAAQFANSRTADFFQRHLT